MQVLESKEEEEEDKTNNEVISLTPQLVSVFGDHIFGTEESLHQFMGKKGICTFQIVLFSRKLSMVMPSAQLIYIKTCLSLPFFMENGATLVVHMRYIFQGTPLMNWA